MSTTINLPTILRGHAGGQRTIEVAGMTVGEVFADVWRSYPKLAEQLTSPDGGLAVFMNVFVDDEDIRYLAGLDTTVDEHTEITILPAVAGG
ncbi:MAG TPA: MoaD/ThiS family protein [Acidimicrobiia bacterium]|nr:MoaD/ThiS family protein [Acidimicrobiia bacterium]